MLFAQSQMFGEIQPSLPRALMFRGLSLRRLSFKDLSEEVEKLESQPSLKLTTDREDLSKEEVMNIFTIFDRHQAGFIDMHDLCQFMNSNDENVTIDQVKEIFIALEKDENGVLSFEDLYKLMNS